MDSEVEVKRGFPDSEKVLELLNSAFGGWGDEAYLSWKYDDFPNFEEKQVWFIEDEGEVIAFTRLFSREMVDREKGENKTVFVWGDTAVAEEHQGEGLFSRLKEERSLFEVGEEKLLMAFVEEGSITHKVHEKKGRSSKVLPVYTKYLSPAKLIREYGKEILEERGWLERVLYLFGKRIILDFEDSSEKYSLRELLGFSRDGKDAERLFTHEVELNEYSTNKLFEKVINAESLDEILLELYEVFFGSDEEIDVADSVEADLEVRRHGDAEELDIEEIEELYSRVLSDVDLHFRRERRDVKHMLSYPHLVEVVSVEGDEDLKGMAAIGKRPGLRGTVSKFKVLDMLYEDRKTYDTLVEEIETVAREEGGDMITFMAGEEPKGGWAELENNLLMWDVIEDDGLKSRLENSEWWISYYDLV